jgi:hypothetical protein
LSKTAPFHPLFIKKNLNGVVLKGIVGLLLSLDARGRGRKRRLSLVFFPLPLSPKLAKLLANNMQNKPDI